MPERRVAIVSDSTCDIPDPLLEELGIHLAPVHVLVDGQDYRDRLDISIDRANELMLEGTHTLTTSGALGLDFLAAYERALQLAPSVVSFSISPTLSVTYQSAVQAREMLEDHDITVIDAKTILAGLGLPVLAAARAAAQGAGRDAVLRVAHDALATTRMVVISQSTAFMARGGRLSQAEEVAAASDQSIPILRIWERGWKHIDAAPSRQAGLERLLSWMQRDLTELGWRPGQPLQIAVDHIVCPEEAAWLTRAVEAAFPVAESFIWQIGPTAGVHLGPGTVGVAYRPLQEASL